VTSRLVVDLGADGVTRVAVVPDGKPSAAAEAAALAWPLDDVVLEDLRWYLEDYLRAPFGVYEDRGARIGASIRRWGESVFSAVFGSGPARDVYARLRARLDVELVFRSSVPSLLGLPWELMTDPGRDRPLALDIAGVSRSLSGAPDAVQTDAVQTVAVPDGRLRVLMVISRPAGAADVGYRMIARPLLERLEAVRGAVDMVVLRPPTVAALRAELADAAVAGIPYQVVHFDGHGVFFGSRTADGGEGALVFERPEGGPHYVPAAAIARALQDAGVPVVVLNACQSGAVGKELEAAVATRLLHEGVASVVAMAYTVYAVAAAEFMAAFYEKLFAGGTVSAAVTAGRQQMFRTPGRPSPKGDLPLADWLVPVHYLRREVSFPQAVRDRPAWLVPLPDALESMTAATGDTKRGELDPAGGVFVGRDTLFYELESAVRRQQVVVLAGTAGAGKTELAKAFGRWWRDTGGVDRPDWVFWHSFEPGMASFGLDCVLGEIGTRLYGTQFSLLEADQRHGAVLDALTTHRMLLIWDNFESVRTLPDPGRATPPLDEVGCGELRAFLGALAGGQSSVVITSRAREEWLGDFPSVAVGALAKHEAVEYAGVLLAPYAAASQWRKGREFGELMEWLDGHPLSMRLVLPRLDSAAPTALLASLSGFAPLDADAVPAAGRGDSLTASIAYSYAHLSESTRRLLPAVALLGGMADATVLGAFSRAREAPGRFSGATVGDWDDALWEAAGVGLLTSLGSGMYKIHPALPGYLAQAWRGEEADDHAAMRDAAMLAMLTGHASRGEWLRDEIESGDAGLAYLLIELERHTLGSFLGYAIDHGLWEAAQSIVAPLDLYWYARGLDAEASAWADRIRSATEAVAGPSPRLDTPLGRLWLLVIGDEAASQLRQHRHGAAESTYLQIVAAAQGMGSSPARQHQLAVAYHQLAAVAQEGERLDEAEQWCLKALAIKEQLGDRRLIVTTQHLLGVVAQKQGRLDEAEQWYKKVLAVEQELGNVPAVMIVFHSLGMIAQARKRLDEAEGWFRRSLRIQAGLGDKLAMAGTYHQLGLIAQERGSLRQAEESYLKALTIEEELESRPHLAATYHQLGIIAQQSGALAEAEGWYRRSLAIKEQLDDQQGMAKSYHQLGELAHDRGQPDEALEWYRRSLDISEELSDWLGMASTYEQSARLAAEQGLLREALTWAVRCLFVLNQIPPPPAWTAPQELVRLTARLGMPVLEETWLHAAGAPLPEAAREWVEAQLREDGDLSDR
jgi:tetratricopeptide (TPR) repeat protein